MKKSYLTFFAILITVNVAHSQWTTGTNIYNTNAGFIGINTTDPAARLDVNGNGIYTGSLQIGHAKVNSNSTKLFIKNDFATGKNWALSSGENGYTEEGFHIYNWTDNPGRPVLSINNGGSTLIRNIAGATLTLEKTSTGIPGIIFQGGVAQSSIEGGNDYLTAYVGGSRRFTILANVNIGIGTANPTEILSVNGIIRSKEIKVENTAWPDYVFNNDYTLRSLSEVKAYIDKNQHLPEIPSAKEITRDGVNVGEINGLLLKKIEELTLYLIEKDKEIKEQKTKIDSQEQRLQQIETFLGKK